jgi:hypothetical protein
MGTVIRFPDEKRTSFGGGARAFEGPGAVVVLPVIRIERHIEEPGSGRAPEAGTPRGPGRRRPGRRP